MNHDVKLLEISNKLNKLWLVAFGQTLWFGIGLGVGYWIWGY